MSVPHYVLREVSPRDLISGKIAGNETRPRGRRCWGKSQAPSSAAQPIGRGIVPKRVSFAAKRFVQLRQITMRLKKIGSMFEGFLIRRDGRTPLLSILKNDAKVEMREREFRLELKRTSVTDFRVGQVAKVVMQEPQIDVGIGHGRM